MDESAIPQDNRNLALEKGLSCDTRHRFAISSVYAIPAYRRTEFARLITQNWHLSAIYQFQTGMPFTISVFGDTANSGTVLGENPIRANVTGQPIFGPGTHTADKCINPAAFAAPPAFTYAKEGRNTLYGPSTRTLDLALARSFTFTDSLAVQLRAEASNALTQVKHC